MKRRAWISEFTLVLTLVFCWAWMPARGAKAHRKPLLSTSANHYQAPWISAPQTDSTSMLWFLRTYKQVGRPRKAYVSVASTGKTQLLVNGMNVSRSHLCSKHRLRRYALSRPQSQHHLAVVLSLHAPCGPPSSGR